MQLQQRAAEQLLDKFGAGSVTVTSVFGREGVPMKVFLTGVASTGCWLSSGTDRKPSAALLALLC